MTIAESDEAGAIKINLGGEVESVIIQPDQINMAVLICYLVRTNSRVRYCIVAYTGQVTFTIK